MINKEVITKSKRKSPGFNILKLIEDRDNWKRKAEALKHDLEIHKAWGVKIDKWHTELCSMLGIKPVHPYNFTDKEGA